MTIDNDVYDRMADTWWDEQGFLHAIRTMLNPARVEYLRGVLDDTFGDREISVLDIGCGGGLLAEEIASDRRAVTGMDPSRRSVAVAREHALAAGLSIRYLVARGESVPFADASFDAVYCCDTLEHVDDLGAVVNEAVRVLAPGGPWIYDTVNRTLRSKLIAIKLMQEWNWTRVMPENFHEYERFIRPDEMAVRLRPHGIEPRGLTGLNRMFNPLRAVRTLRQCRRGDISFAEAGRRMALRPSRDTSLLYMAHGFKPCAGER